jgi:transcription elongation GreA/GreB family factor
MRNVQSHLPNERIRALARERLKTEKPNDVAASWGIARNTVVSIAADAPVREATFALVRERIAQADAGRVSNARKGAAA